MPSFALSLVAVATLAAAGWEPIADPALGAEVLRPTGWQVEALANDALVVRAPAPLGGQTTIIPLRGVGLTARALVIEVTRLLGAVPAREQAMSTGHAALVRYADPASPQTPRTALVIAAVSGERAVVSILSAPSAEFEAARPALAAVAQHLVLKAPEPSPEPPAPLFAPVQEPKEQAFSAELPRDWKQDLSAAIVPGEAPYVRASAIGRSADRLFAFVHYKLASFQEPQEGAAPAAPDARPYQAGALALESYLFPKAVEKSPADFGEWRITDRGGAKSLYGRDDGVRFDGELVRYEYRFRGQVLHGNAFVVTYRLPSKQPATWFLYGLYGWEAPPGREFEASQAALRLLSSFCFERRYSSQADVFWTIARDRAIEALSASAPKSPQPQPVIARKPDGAALNAIESAALELTALPAEGTIPAVGLSCGIPEVVRDGQSAPAPNFQELESLR